MDAYQFNWTAIGVGVAILIGAPILFGITIPDYLSWLFWPVFLVGPILIAVGAWPKRKLRASPYIIENYIEEHSQIPTHGPMSGDTIVNPTSKGEAGSEDYQLVLLAIGNEGPEHANNVRVELDKLNPPDISTKETHQFRYKEDFYHKAKSADGYTVGEGSRKEIQIVRYYEYGEKAGKFILCFAIPTYENQLDSDKKYEIRISVKSDNGDTIAGTYQFGLNRSGFYFVKK